MSTYRVTCLSTTGRTYRVTVQAESAAQAMSAAPEAYYANTRRDGALARRLRVELAA